MICVECKNPNVKHAYSRYKGNYLKLDVCPSCNKLVDKYIEYDKVLLFLDLMLLKPQAYRHLCFNVIESELLKGEKVLDTGIAKLKVLSRFNQVFRFLVLTILFEVYLLWATEEKRPQHTKLMEFVLQQNSYVQYGIFILKVVLNGLFFNIPLQLIFFKFLGWKDMHNQNVSRNLQTIYHSVVLFTNVLTANCIKILPIFILIWPYDKTLEASQIVFAISILNTIESFKLISNASYPQIIVTYTVCILIQEIMTSALLSLILSTTSSLDFMELFTDKFHDFFALANSFITLSKS